MAYVDESGDSGYAGSQTYTLGCILLPVETWPTAFDGFIAYRRMLKQRFGVRVRDEVKANYLVRAKHGCAGLGEGQRYAIYRGHLRLTAKLGASAFAVVIRKNLIANQARNPRDIAWEFLLQRVAQIGIKGGQQVLLTHDEGDNRTIRQLARRARRAGTAGSAFGTARLKVPARLLIDDPVSRDSGQSYFIQLADLVAYAAFRTIIPPPPRAVNVCPAGMWGELGSEGTFAEANELMGSQTGARRGIVVWPY